MTASRASHLVWTRGSVLSLCGKPVRSLVAQGRPLQITDHVLLERTPPGSPTTHYDMPRGAPTCPKCREVLQADLGGAPATQDPAA